MHNILIVDDEPLILEGLRSVIEWEDYGLRIAGQAGNGEEALEFLHRHNEAIDILITDITMPKLTGLELIQQIKCFDSKMRFIILSGYEQFEYLKAGMSLGIENYILKPINIKELESTIEQIVEVLNQEDVEQFHAKEDQQVLRNNILNRWVTGNIDRQELMHRSKVLNISLDCSFLRWLRFGLLRSMKGRRVSINCTLINLWKNVIVSLCSPYLSEERLLYL